jgi:CBS domain containing-hemolysin-like protein
MQAEGGWSVEALVWMLVVLLPASALVSVLSALLERSGPIRLRHWAEEAGESMRALYDQPLRFGVFRSLLSLAGRLLPIALLLVLVALLRAGGARRTALSGLLIVALLLAAVEVVNRALVARDPERALRGLTLFYRAARLVLAPLITLVGWAVVSLVPRRLEGREGRTGRREEPVEDEAASDEEIEAFIDVGTREGILEPEQGEWLSNIVDFGETQARSVMTPRIDMICAPIDASLDALAERFIASGHSRIPLFQDSIDHIVGVLHIRDVFRVARSAAPPAIRSLLKPPLFIPETKPLAELLKDLQSRFQQVAIVVDEYGGTAGLVTVEDLLEEIVGEISDEHEDGQAASARVQLGDGAWRLDGRAHLEVLDELFEVEIEDAEYETLAGLIFSALGHVPHPGETVEQEGLLFTVEDVANRRIKTLRVERIVSSSAAAGASGGAGAPGTGTAAAGVSGRNHGGESREETET